ncbi:MAG: Ig-like domain-containing protein [Anaerolineae bacterium]
MCNRSLYRPMTLLVVFVMVVTSCQPAVPAPTPVSETAAPGERGATVPLATVAPTRQPVAVEKPLPPAPPVVVSHKPARGEEVPPLTPVVMRFNQPMEPQSVRAAFRISPPVPGEVKVEGATVEFVPSAAYERGARYEVTLEGDAKSEKGLPLGHPFTLAFRAEGYLEVAEVQPADGAKDVEPRPRLAVVFNRPVVPLTALPEQGKLPQPVVLEPAAPGKGEWLNTSIYVFEPERELAAGTTYTVTVPAGLESVSGLRMEEDFVWSFTTLPPKVLEWSPKGDLVKPTEPISLTFSYPMDQAAAEALFELVPKGSQAQVPGSFQWKDDGRVMVFQPSARLDWGTEYVATLRAGAHAREGVGVVGEETSWSFRAVPLPAILRTEPADGEEKASPYGGISIFFVSPMDFGTIMPNTTILPKPTEVYTYWDEYENRFYIGFDKAPSTAYTVTLGAKMADPYGNTLGKDVVVRFRTRALDPAAYLVTPGKVGVYNAYTDTLAYVGYRNVATLEFSLYRMTDQAFASVNTGDSWRRWRDYRPDPADLVRSWTFRADAPFNQTRIAAVPLHEEGGPLPPGIYYLECRAPEIKATDYELERARHILVVTRWNILLKHTADEALVWVTDLATGRPVPNVPLTITEGASSQAIPPVEGKTDSSGLFHAAFSERRKELWQPLLVLAQDGDEKVAVSSEWEEGISPWNFDLPTEFYRDPYQGYLYTDRPIYRPGQKVYWKAFLRGDDDAHYTLLGVGEEVRVTVYDGEGKQVYQAPHTLSEMGTLHGELLLDEEASLGYYTINVKKGAFEFGGSFQVAEYRKPEYQIEVRTDKDSYVQGDIIEAEVSASYYFGGPVKEAQVRWTLMTADHYFHPPKLQGYDFVDYDWAERGREQMGRFGEVIAEGNGTTDAQGRFAFRVPADIARYSLSQRFTLDVTVTDVNNQEVASQAEVVVHKGLFYIGLKPDQYVGLAGEEASVHVVTVDTEGITVTQTTVNLVFNEHRWYSVQEVAEDGSTYWTFSVEDVPVYTTTVTTDDNGHALASFTPEKGGTYKIVATGKDGRGNEVRASTYLWVSGRKGEYIPWRRENHNRIDLVADKDRYEPGETAKVLVASPYTGPVWALVTVERGRILESKVLTLASNSETLTVPVQASFTPNAFVCVTLVKGMDEAEPTPSFRMGYAELHISTAHKRLRVEITPDKEQARPREEVSFAIRVSDADGNPVRAELSLALVDLSVLALGGVDPGSLFDRYWQERGLAVRNAASLSVAIDKVAKEVAREAKGGGGGMGAEMLLIRREFPDTAYWNPALQTDAQGQAQITIRLPDNLTTWRLGARAITADTLIGEAQTDIVSTLPLLVRPVAPRFFVIGDRAELAAIVHNNTEADMEVEVRFLASGLDVRAPTTTKAQVPAAGLVKLAWPVVVVPTEEVTLRFAAVGSQASDAVEITLPVYHYSTPEVVATAGQVDAGEERLEAIALPQVLDPTMGELTVQLEPSLAAGMQKGLTYLEYFPYHCIEQTVSRFLPNVMAYRALKSLGIKRPELETRLPQMVGAALQRIYAEQKYDGGWGWWVTEASNPFLTAYTLLGLVEAARADFAVDAGVMAQGAKFLSVHLYSTKDLENRYKANSQAFMLYVLSEYYTYLDRGDRLPVSQTVNLYEQRERLSYYGKALLALTLSLFPEAEKEATEPRIQTLMSDLTSAAILSATGAHWEEATPDHWTMNTDTRTTSMALMVLARLRPDSALAPNVVRWLMVSRKEGRWQTTQENAWALMALTDWMVATGELEADYSWRATLNGELLGEGAANAQNVDQAVVLRKEVAGLLREDVNRLVLERPAPPATQTGKGRLYYAAHLRYFLPVEEVKAMDRGIQVTRRYELADEPDKPITQAKVGDVIRVKLTLVAPYSLYYLVVEDPLPAGCEAIDVSLKTTSGVYAQGPTVERKADNQRRWWFWWWEPSHSELRDEKVALFTTHLVKGTYEYTYLMRASLPGEYLTMPTHAYEMYFPEVFGRSDGGRFLIAGE